MVDVRSGRLLESKLVIEEDLSIQIGIGITIFTIANNYVSGTMQLYLNGLRQQKGIGKDYVETLPNKITFSFAPNVSDILLIDYIKI